LPSSENLFSTLSYAVFVAPAAVVLIWLAWRVLVFCSFYISRFAGLVFPSLAVERGEAPRLFARNRSQGLSYLFLFCLALPLVFVPLRFLADRLEGPQILLWHWLLVLIPIPLLAIWFAAFVRRKDWWER
jgi:hypothetical protein